MLKNGLINTKVFISKKAISALEVNKMEGKFVSWDEFLKKNKKIDFILSKEQLKRILKDIGNDVDDEGFVINLKNNERVLSNDGDEIKLDELGAVLPGSKEFIKKNIASFSHYLSEQEK